MIAPLRLVSLRYLQISSKKILRNRLKLWAWSKLLPVQEETDCEQVHLVSNG